MGYEIHITRAENWCESDQSPIALGEWLQIVDEDSDLEPRDSGLPGFAIWTAWSRDGHHPPIWYSEGCIVSSATDEPVLRKMYAIAQRLGARLVGDEDEEYDATGKRVGTEEVPPRRPWWKRLFGGRIE